jgi:N-acetyl-anhydromuramyl-L-alanine amidase AmpD
MKIIDKTKQVANHCRQCAQRKTAAISTLVVHRFGPKVNGVNIHTAEDAAAFFSNNPESTGGRMAYHFLVFEDGRVDQALTFEDMGQHTRGANHSSIGIAVIGDFRHVEPTIQQRAALVDLLLSLCRQLRIRQIVSHDEVPGGSADAAKVCPGPKLGLAQIKKEVVSCLVKL